MKKKKKPTTVAELVRMGAEAANAKRTPEERKQIAQKAAEARWKNHKYSTKQSAKWQREFRLKRAREKGDSNDDAA